jgi:tetratricopeptide (TPR) repeat protein
MVEVTEAQMKQAEEFKAEANKAFKGALSTDEVGTRPAACGVAGVVALAAAAPAISRADFRPTSRPRPRSPPTEKHYAAAVVGYSQAIEVRPDYAIYWANRSAAHIRLEEYGSAIADATKSIEVDPDYIKARQLGVGPGAPPGASPAG